MKRVLITGANSYIGNCFEKYICSFSQYEVDTLNMLDETWEDSIFSTYDVILHVAGIVHKKESKANEGLYFKVNCDMAIRAAIKAKNEGVKQFIFLSSMSVYGLEEGNITQNTECNPKTNYAKSKLLAEEGIIKLQDTSFNVCILRPPMIYGKGSKGNYSTLSKYSKILPFFPNINNQRSMLYIENLCEFLRLMIENVESGVYMPQNSEYTNTSQMVKSISQLNGNNVKLVKFFNPFLKLLSPFITVIGKVFGDLTYDKSISEYKVEYRICNLEESIKRSECF